MPVFSYIEGPLDSIYVRMPCALWLVNGKHAWSNPAHCGLMEQTCMVEHTMIQAGCIPFYPLAQLRD